MDVDFEPTMPNIDKSNQCNNWIAIVNAQAVRQEEVPILGAAAEARLPPTWWSKCMPKSLPIIIINAQPVQIKK